jgi:hypothetical protein
MAAGVKTQTGPNQSHFSTLQYLIGRATTSA